MFYFAVVVISSAIVVFFLEEIGRVVKHLFTNPGDHLFILLGIVSASVVAYEEYLTALLNWLHFALQVLATDLLAHFPLLAGLSCVSVACLFCLASLPTWMLFGLMRYNNWSSTAAIAARVYLFTWVFWVVLGLAG